jgi:hypothetical protein
MLTKGNGLFPNDARKQRFSGIFSRMTYIAACMPRLREI